MGLTAEQLDMRRTRLGGSDAPALFGLDKYRSPEDLRQEKLGLAPPFVGNGHTERGEFLEDGVARWAAHRLGLSPDELESWGSILHPKLQHVLATPDRVVKTPAGLVAIQVKCPSFNSFRWSGLWRDEPTAKAVCQLHWELGVLHANGHQLAEQHYVAALVVDEVKTFPVRLDLALSADMHEEAEQWFRKHVLGGEK